MAVGVLMARAVLINSRSRQGRRTTPRRVRAAPVSISAEIIARHPGISIHLLLLAEAVLEIKPFAVDGLGCDSGFANKLIKTIGQHVEQLAERATKGFALTRQQPAQPLALPRDQLGNFLKKSRLLRGQQELVARRFGDSSFAARVA